MSVYISDLVYFVFLYYCKFRAKKYSIESLLLDIQQFFCGFGEFNLRKFLDTELQEPFAFQKVEEVFKREGFTVPGGNFLNKNTGHSLVSDIKVPNSVLKQGFPKTTQREFPVTSSSTVFPTSLAVSNIDLALFHI